MSSAGRCCRLLVAKRVVYPSMDSNADEANEASAMDVDPPEESVAPTEDASPAAQNVTTPPTAEAPPAADAVPPPKVEPPVDLQPVVAPPPDPVAPRPPVSAAPPKKLGLSRSLPLASKARSLPMSKKALPIISKSTKEPKPPKVVLPKPAVAKKPEGSMGKLPFARPRQVQTKAETDDDMQVEETDKPPVPAPLESTPALPPIAPEALPPTTQEAPPTDTVAPKEAQAAAEPSAEPPHPPQEQIQQEPQHMMEQPIPPGMNIQYPGRIPNRPVKELKVEDALLYLDDVKREFAMQPAIYNEFLVIMKNFKSQTVDTPGVIVRVSKLFQGYNNLILGFNTFLPEGHKISMEDLKRMERERALQEAEEAKKNAPPAKEAPRGRKQKESPERNVEARPQQQQHQTVEFDHAISYVTTIKRRFATDASTYQQFLEILHNYQKEQRGIKEVLEQVAHLFQDHPDLLKEFTFFLPDSVQEQARERMHRAAAESESRIAKRQKQLEMSQSPQQNLDMSRHQPVGSKRNFEISHATSPDQFVYNAAVERQFFDETRETLSALQRDGGQAWGEFLKCLDMYAQEILSRSDMLKHVEPILGKRNSHLFEEFKRILSVAGSASISNQVLEDSWYSVPLAEIDFSRCRKCSPSYRALPRDYPAHPCSGRNPTDSFVLNDIWVSLPVGSEESYTFRHMRRNTYEEALFRVEDERFEIDMIIDSNRITLQRLLPIAEEIAFLSKEDVFPSDLGLKPAEGTGLGGRRFAYTFDKSILGVVHRNSITRIYGDSGQEMLDLLVKNPTVAVPLVTERLRQKDKEFRAVRDRLGRQWKEIAEQNYHKSLDHRSLTWRTTDKRAISTRTLVAEIKDRAMNCGRESEEAYRQKLDKAKEERGAFYEYTVGSQLSRDTDTTFLPKPDRRIFTPHLNLVYQNVSWAQRDAYRILSFALERGPISPSDKERCHRLWVEFLGPWFDLPLIWMQKPAVAYQESSKSFQGSAEEPSSAVAGSEDDDESMEDADMADGTTEAVDEGPESGSSDTEHLDHHPLPAGAHVSTLYGEGKIISFRASEKIYAVKLGFGAVGYLRPATVLCSILPVEKSAYTRQLRAEDRTKLARPNDHLAFGTQNLYLFFRLHQILVHRLNVAKQLAFSVGDDPTMQTMVEQTPSLNPKAAGRRRYEAYLSLVYALLDGSIESGKYEDRVRSLLGHGAYELATMDKLISHIWKDVQAMANDETMWNLVQLYRRHLLAGSFQPEAFRQEAAYLSDGEVMYAFQQCPMIGRDESVLYFEYVGVIEDEDDPNLDEEPFDEGAALDEPATKRVKRM